MSRLRYGLDFGTSNSAIALAGIGAARVLPIDPAAPDPVVAPTVLFITREGDGLIGHEAIRAFVTRNAGREIVRKRVNTGQIISTHYGDEFVQFDADVDAPGRFFQSLKSFLRDESFDGTSVFGRSYTLEELIAGFLAVVKARADAAVGSDVRAVTMGRPVHFTDDGTRDESAQARLRKAAMLAGFDDVEFLYEPIGAALEYEAGLDREELACVFDFGGGTLDFSVIRLGPGRRGRPDRRDDILAVGGVVIGGNTLDEDVMERRLLEYFGSRATARTLSGNSVAYPQWLLSLLRSWHTIQLLNERGTVKFLREFRQIAKYSRDEVDALLCLVQRNYGWELFEEIERVKIALSTQTDAELHFVREAIRIREPLSRRSLERLIAPRINAAEEALLRTLADAQVEPDDIDVVLRTGGSSQIPAVQAMLERAFGAGKVHKQDVFTSIVSGLALAAAA
ncbi:MAG: Hsp70 family protein [Chloroflexi bacterium]|nr:Hsp70 family protein [Chloroflexota bacterium]